MSRRLGAPSKGWLPKGLPEAASAIVDYRYGPGLGIALHKIHASDYAVAQCRIQDW